MARTLSSQLARAFKAPAARKPDLHRKERESAKALAKQHHVEIERVNSGFNVWPPRGFSGEDPFEGDHYAQDWSDVLARVKAYVTA
jgi:hypothetical protein